jgi:hypothetical protein
MPLVDVRMIRTLVERYRADGVPLVVSDYEGVDAPPILYDRHSSELRALEGEGCGKRSSSGIPRRRSAFPGRRASDRSRPAGRRGAGPGAARGWAMRAELLQLAADLASRRQPFVLAMVVRRQPYSSAHQGDMAVITADGGYHGWLGGNAPSRW